MFPAGNVNPDGSLRPLSVNEQATIALQTAKVADGEHPTWRLDPSGCQVHRPWFFKGTAAGYTQKQLQDMAVFGLLGAVSLYRDQTNKLRLSRVLPMIVPGYPQYAALAIETITGAKSVGKDDADMIPAYLARLADVRHELVFFGLLPDDMIPTDQIGAEQKRYVQVLPSKTEVTYLTLNAGSMCYARADGFGAFGFSLPLPHGVPIPFVIGRPEVQTSFSLKWWRLPRQAWGPGTELTQKIKGNAATGRGPLIGCVNRALFQGRDPGTVLLMGVDEEVVPDLVADDLCWNLTFNFLEKSQGHNNMFWAGQYNDTSASGYYLATKGATPQWFPAGNIPDGKALFNERDLNDLFDPGF